MSVAGVLWAVHGAPQHEPTDGEIDGVNPNPCVPALTLTTGPVFRDWSALCQQNHDASKVCDEQPNHKTVQKYHESPLLLDAKEQEADGTLDQADAGKEQDLRVPSQHVVVDVVVGSQVRAVPAVAELVDLHHLDCEAHETQYGDKYDSVVVCADGPELEPNEEPGEGRYQDQGNQDAADSQERRPGILVRELGGRRSRGGHGDECRGWNLAGQRLTG